MGRVAGKVALITGGASGIGRACAERLAEEGAIAIVTDIQDALGAEVVTGIRAAGGEAEYHPHDVTDEAAWMRVIDAVVAAHGGLHVLVNNAGIGVGGSIVEMELSEWQRQQAINLDGVFLGVKHGIRAMREAGGGSIINMSSVAGLKGAPNLAAYNATKGGVRLFTKGVALECAHAGWNIRVNSVHPGIIDTPIWTKVNPDFLAEGENAVDVEAMARAAVPGGRLGKPLDIANGVLYLASDESSYVSGTELVIDGTISA
ncbi:MAG: glucose 1-dehydrogenase [Pseudomonadota bacterium]|nr:glucose 1-dehydrogenase [Pseudomonadota bacterium]